MRHLRAGFRWPGLLLVGLLVLVTCGCRTTPVGERAAWRGQKPVVAEGKIAHWAPAPEFLFWRQAELERDGFTGLVLRVSLTGPFIEGAWSQHAGAIWRLPREIPAGQPFTLRFRARSLEGSRHLTVLRTWGGTKPWDTIEIAADWRDYEVTLTPQSDTTQITFSLAPKKGRLQPYCAGVFELHGVALLPVGASGP